MNTQKPGNVKDEFASLKRISFIKSIIIVLLLIGGGIISYKYFSPKFKLNIDKLGLVKPKWTPEETDKALINLEAYRDDLIYAKLAWYNKSKAWGIVHDTTSMKDYIAFFKTFCNNHTVKDGYKWEVGYYPMVCKEAFGNDGNIRPRLSIYMIPTMVSIKDPKDILDYMDPKNSSYYPSQKIVSEKYIYNQGTIFP